jgi:hypothetical protein
MQPTHPGWRLRWDQLVGAGPWHAQDGLEGTTPARFYSDSVFRPIRVVSPATSAGMHLPTPVLRRLLFRLICPGVLLIGELHVWLATQARDSAGWWRSIALLAWLPCRAVFVAGYGALVILAESAHRAT